MSNARFSITPGRAVQDTDLTDAEFRTLAALGLFTDKDGWCWPAQATLAKLTGKKRPTINAHIQKLAKAGYINVQHRFTDKGGKTSNKYQVRLDYPPGGMSAQDDIGYVSPGLHTMSAGADINTPINNPTKTNSRLTPGSKRKRSTKPRDPRLDHPAYKAYQQTARWSVPVTFRDELIETVGDDPEAVERWRVLVRDWEGKGWNKRNIKGMLECYRTGGIKARKNGAGRANGSMARAIQEMRDNGE